MRRGKTQIAEWRTRPKDYHNHQPAFVGNLAHERPQKIKCPGEESLASAKGSRGFSSDGALLGEVGLTRINET
jgi:hypothetical protein